MMTVFALLLACAIGFAFYQFAEAKRWRAAANDLGRERETQRAEAERLRLALAAKEGELDKNREVAEVQLRLLAQTQQQLDDKFRALAAEALKNNSQLLLDRSREQIQHLVEPVQQSLQRFEQHVQAVEVSRVGAYEGLTAQVKGLADLQERLRQSTEQLKTALRSPIQRGRWGEMQLRRVVELAGMLEYCDFAEQKTLFGETNQRPDLTIRLPNDCHVVVDAKVSLDAYLRALETQDEAERRHYLESHARQVRTHLKQLGEKAYWQRLSNSPEFVIAFLPLEALFSAALEHDPELLDFGVQNRVVLATPMTLITLLLTIAHGWRQQALAENVDRIREAGIELHGRILKMSEHFARMGDAIERTVETYNQTVGSLERNVLTSARRFRELRPANAAELDEIRSIQTAPRDLDPAKWRAIEA